MNYYEARQLKDKSGWHFTCMNDGRIWPVGYCRDHEAHDTREEAEQCFARYLLDGQREETYGDWTGCVAPVDEAGTSCDTPTKAGLTTRQPLGHGYPLCDEHRTPEMLARLAPDSIGQIVASY
jgi:hypothetical protein